MGAGFQVTGTDGSRAYDWIMNLLAPPQAALDALGRHLKSSDTVIELGCGTGRTTDLLSKHVSSIIACDSSSEMINRFQASGVPGNVRVIDGDIADESTLEEASADAAVCLLGGTQYVNEIVQQTSILRNIYHWLRPGGRVVIEMFDRAAYDSLLGEHRFPIEYGKTRMWLDMSVSREGEIYTCVTNISEQSGPSQDSGFTEVFRPNDVAEARNVMHNAGFVEVTVEPDLVNHGFLWVTACSPD